MDLITAKFQTSEGESKGPTLSLPLDTTPYELEIILNKILNNDEHQPYSFFVEETEIISSVREDVIKNKSSEISLVIIYLPQAIFRVRPVTRCASTMSGHTEAILSVHFSPDGKNVASGSGDKTVRIWEIDTSTTKATLKGHLNWVLSVAWSPDASFLASGSMDGGLNIWDMRTENNNKSKNVPTILKGHKDAITSLSWEPLHLCNTNNNLLSPRLCSASRDGTIRVWDVILGKNLFSMTQHTRSVTCIKWGGYGTIYSGSQDCCLKIWNSNNGSLIQSLSGHHAHWINAMSLSNDSILRSGPYSNERINIKKSNLEESIKLSIKKFNNNNKEEERLVTASDDFTLILWRKRNNNEKLEEIIRMTGHQAAVTGVVFSPSGRLIASASFDKSVKIWDGLTGKFLYVLRGHVSAVYQAVFSADERLLLTGSRDSTCKVWDLRSRKLRVDLPGHSDEVYAVDWSPTGDSACSGSKDCTLKVWRS